MMCSGPDKTPCSVGTCTMRFASTSFSRTSIVPSPVIALDSDSPGVRADNAMLQTPDGSGRLELTKFHSPSHQGGDRQAPANAPGIRHVLFTVDDIDAAVAGLQARGTELVGEVVRYEDSFRLCYVRGPEGIIVELSERM